MAFALIFHAQYFGIFLRKARFSLRTITPAVNYKWETVDNVSVPIMKDNLPALFTMIGMSIFPFQKNCNINAVVSKMC